MYSFSESEKTSSDALGLQQATDKTHSFIVPEDTDSETDSDDSSDVWSEEETLLEYVLY